MRDERFVAANQGGPLDVNKHRLLAAWAADLVRELGGLPFTVPEAGKPLYHAAACLASNTLTTLIHMVEEIYLSLGLERSEAIRAFWPLVMGTLKNIERSGSVQALTGPISRGDAGTIDQHIRALRERLPEYLPTYREMGLLTVELALRKKSLSPQGAAVIRKVLQGELAGRAAPTKRTPGSGRVTAAGASGSGGKR